MKKNVCSSCNHHFIFALILIVLSSSCVKENRKSSQLKHEQNDQKTSQNTSELSSEIASSVYHLSNKSRSLFDLLRNLKDLEEESHLGMTFYKIIDFNYKLKCVSDNCKLLKKEKK